MLRLEKIEISGFKSFVDPVRLHFAGGVTGIVGPNGCGKSNISDSITWVLGEQSAKSLRGATMEDVIFNGSERRKPLGMAEVTMTLRTDPGFPHAEDGRITLTRRVFRSGDSQYRLNGKVVRLKDFKDLLMDTGLGIRAYSVIEQGKIGMILSGKPQERRRLLEEAAGITRYKTRKKIAEVKLEEATANLLRLDDIVSEVERAMRSLKRQAAAAERFREREVEYLGLLEQVLVGRWSRLLARLRTNAQALAAAVDAESELAARIHQGEAELASGRELADELAKRLAEIHEQHSSLGARIEGRQDLLKASRASVIEVSERATSSERLATEKESALAGHGDSLAALAARRLELVVDLEGAEVEAGEGKRKLAGAEEQLAAAAARVEEHRRGLLATVAEINGVRQRLHLGQIEVERGSTRRRLLDEELERYAHETRQAEEHLTLSRETVTALERRLAEKDDELETGRRALEDTQRREAAAVENRRRIETELTTERQRRDVLQRLAAAHTAGRSGLEAALAAAGIEEPIYLAERLQAIAGWERSLDFFLGGLTDAVLLGDASGSLPLARTLSAGSTAAALVAPVPLGELGAEPLPRLEDPAIALSLAEALGVAPELAAALPPAYLVDRAEDAERLARRHPGYAFLSPDGFWAQGGVIHVEGREALPGVLERERELARLAEAIPELELAFAEAIELVETLVAERAERATAVNRVEAALTQLRQEIAVGSARRQDIEARYERLKREQAAITAEHGTVVENLQHLSVGTDQLAAALVAAETRHRETQDAFDEAQVNLETAQAQKENLRAESAGRASRLELLRERLAAHDRETARLERERTEGQEQVRLWREEGARLVRRKQELEAQIERAELELQQFLEERAHAEEEVLAAQKRLDDHRDSLRELTESTTSRRLEHEAVRSRVEDLRVAEAGLKGESEHLAATFTERFEREPPADPPAAPENLDEMEVDLARRREALERMGPVNALALDEYKEQEERFGFLSTQRADVTQSIASLKQTIKEINQTSSERFKETFTEVNKAFGEVFMRLFRGGEAEMRLLDEEDLLESGIEIVARPPGKRLQNIMLMSGGEKALTAIALLFALFQTKPSPFCILDEVDAPLDDANALRFNELLREMTDTQLIIITHNKLTMQIASTLYGVTMEERGVSKVVAVEMDSVQPELAATA